MCRITNGHEYRDSQWMQLIVQPEDPAVVARKRRELELLQQQAEVIYQRDGFDHVDAGVAGLHLDTRHPASAATAAGAACAIPLVHGKRLYGIVCLQILGGIGLAPPPGSYAP